MSHDNPSFPLSDQNKVQRIPNRGHYDKATVYAILDSAMLCHVGFNVDGQPFVIPTLYGREDDRIYIHGSAASRMLRNLAQGIPVCLTVTHVDGLVLARSAFHHSMNYRSAVVFGTATEVPEEEKEHALFVISENVLKGRWDEARPPNEKELKATTVLSLNIETASAKIRTGPPGDDDEDYALPIWAGVVPVTQSLGKAENDPKLREGIEVAPSVVNILQSADRREEPSVKIKHEIDPNPSEAEVKFIDDQLGQYNDQQTGSRESQQLNLVVRGDEGQVIAGLKALIRLDWLYVQILWVDEQHRRHGLGSKLMQHAEGVGREKGCTGVCLSSFSFQGPDFYRARGYDTCGQIDDYPAGSTLYFLLKRFKE